MKDNRITGDDLHVNTWAIHFIHLPVNEIGGGQSRRRLNYFIDVWSAFLRVRYEAHDTHVYT